MPKRYSRRSGELKGIKVPSRVILKLKGVFTAKDNYRYCKGDIHIYQEYFRSSEDSGSFMYVVDHSVVGTLLDNSEPVAVFERMDIYETEEGEAQ